MPKEHRERMLAHAGAFLAKIGFGSAKGFRLTLLVPRKTRIEICCNGLAVPSEVPCGEQRGRWLSPLDEQAVEALAGGEWMTTAQIIEVIGEEPSDLRVILRNLAARGILESCTRRGFRLLD